MAVEAGAAFSVGKGLYLGGNVRDLESSMFGGWSASGSLGVSVKPAVGIGVFMGVDFGLDSRNRPILMNIKTGGSATVGVATPINGSLGAGYSTPMKRIF